MPPATSPTSPRHRPRNALPHSCGLESAALRPARWLDNPLGRHSYAYDFAIVGSAVELSDLADKLSGDPARNIDFRYSLGFPDGQVPMNVQNNDQDEVRTARDLAAGAVALDLFDPAVDRFATLAREHGFSGVVAYAPAAYTAYAEFVTFEDPSLADLMAAFSRSQRDHLRDVCAARGLPFVDLTSPLQAAARERGRTELLYFPINVHYTPAGHRVAADALAAAIGARSAGR
jgi:hypothetical protein